MREFKSVLVLKEIRLVSIHDKDNEKRLKSTFPLVLSHALYVFLGLNSDGTEEVCGWHPTDPSETG